MSQYGMDGQIEDPDEMYRREMAAVRQAGAVAKAKRAQEGQTGVRGWINKLPRNLTLGMYDAAVNTLRAPFDAADWVKDAAAESLESEGKRPKPAEAPAPALPAKAIEIAAAGRKLLEGNMQSGTADQMTEDVLQFALPFTGWMKMLGGFRTGATLVQRAAPGIAADAITAATAVGPEDDRMADLIEMGREMDGRLGNALRAIAPDGSLVNRFIEYIASKDDTAAENRFRNVLDSATSNALIGGAVMPAVALYKGLRSVLATKDPAAIAAWADKNLGSTETPAAPAAQTDDGAGYHDVTAERVGFKQKGPNKPFEDQNYSHVEYVEVDFGDHKILDAVRGLNGPHAMKRAEVNWPGAKVTRVPRGDMATRDPELIKEVEKAMPNLKPPKIDPTARPTAFLADPGFKFPEIVGAPGTPVSAAVTARRQEFIKQANAKGMGVPVGWKTMAWNHDTPPVLDFTDDLLVWKNPKSTLGTWAGRLREILDAREKELAPIINDRAELREMLAEVESRGADIPVRSYHSETRPNVSAAKFAAYHSSWGGLTDTSGTKVARFNGFNPDGTPDIELLPQNERELADPTGPDDIDPERHGDRIVLAPAAFSEAPRAQFELMLHEMAHNYSVRKVDRASAEDLKEIRRLQTALSQRATGEFPKDLKTGRTPNPTTGYDMMYGLNPQAPKEFFAEMFGNVELRKLAKRTADPANKGRTLFDSFVELEKKMLGITGTALMIKLIEGGESAESTGAM